MSPERNVNIRHVSRENIHRNPPRLIFGEQFRRRPPSRLILVIDIGERLSVVVADDKAGGSRGSIFTVKTELNSLSDRYR
jgi:hypothetical protein